MIKNPEKEFTVNSGGLEHLQWSSICDPAE
jgi:hypothetical protein